eukprot:scaffold49866_cov59-Phaeocystis_antarctica.AAC.1
MGASGRAQSSSSTSSEVLRRGCLQCCSKCPVVVCLFYPFDPLLQAAVHAFRGVPQGRAAGAWDVHAALMDRSRDRYG